MVKFFQQHMWNFEQYALFQLFDLRANYWHGRLARANQKKQGSEPAVGQGKSRRTELADPRHWMRFVENLEILRGFQTTSSNPSPSPP